MGVKRKRRTNREKTYNITNRLFWNHFKTGLSIGENREKQRVITQLIDGMTDFSLSYLICKERKDFESISFIRGSIFIFAQLLSSLYGINILC